MIDSRNADIYGPDGFFRPWQELKLPILRDTVTGAIVEEEVPSGVVTSCGEEDEGDFCYVEE